MPDTTGQLLRILQSADKPLVAADLAARLYLTGNRELQRRKVRALVKELRDDKNENNWIVANFVEGYWLSDDFALWKDYLEGKKITAKMIFADVARKKNQVAMAGQGKLF